MEIMADRVVLIHYTLKDDAGAVIDSSAVFVSVSFMDCVCFFV